MQRLFFFFFMFVLLSCGQSKTNKEKYNKPLTKGQYETLEKVVQEITDISSATQSFVPKGDQRERELIVSKKGQTYKETFDRLVYNPRYCLLDKQGKNGGNNHFKKIEVKSASGSDCPIYALTTLFKENDKKSLGGGATLSKINFSSQTQFEVFNSPETSSLFVFIDMTKLTASFLGSESITNRQGDKVVTTRGEGSGDLYSKSEGQVRFIIRKHKKMGTSKSKNVFLEKVFTYMFDFKDFSVAGIVRGTQEASSKKLKYTYKINGRLVSKKQFRKYFGTQIANIEMDFEK